jgi:hypothetical protein
MGRDNLRENRKNISKSPGPSSNSSSGCLNNKEYDSIPPDRFYTEKEEVTLRFYQTPKALFNNHSYKRLSLGAKLMYSILRDRLDISVKNDWKDEHGFIYLTFTIDEMAKLLEITRKTAIKHKKELNEYGLIIDKRLGQGNPNRIYVLKPELDSFQKCNFYTSRNVNNGLQEVENLHPIDTNVNETKLNNVNKTNSEKVVEKSTEETRKVNAETNKDVNDIRRKIKKSLKGNEKLNFINPQDLGRVKNNYQKDRNLKDNKPEKNTESKRYRLEEDESLAKEISEVLEDDHSLGAFRVIVDKIPKQRIRILLSIIKDTYLTGRIRKSRGAMFISLARDYARENNINLNFK